MPSTTSRARARVYEVLTNPPPGDTMGRVIGFAIMLLIAGNVTASILETDVDLARRAPEFFQWFERISVAVFTVEYLARLWASSADPRFGPGIRGRLRMALTPMALVDLAAIAPFYVDLISPGAVDLRFLRVLRLLRLFRLLRIRRLSESLAMLGRIASSKRAELGVTLGVVVVAVLLSAGAMYLVERSQPSTQFTSIPRAMWWAICTVTTVGYGDMVPTSPPGQAIAGFVAFIGICALALPVGILSSGFIDEINRRKSLLGVNACPHCGATKDHAAVS